MRTSFSGDYVAELGPRVRRVHVGLAKNFNWNYEGPLTSGAPSAEDDNIN